MSRSSADFRRKSCVSKRRYPTLVQAESAMKRIKESMGNHMITAAYHCRYCGGYHWGHSFDQIRES